MSFLFPSKHLKIDKAKPISSPAKTEKFPPPLIRFPRSKSSRRRRSRATRMFLRRKTPLTETITQEPSSPKVTCIGQVRVRRPTNNKNAAVAVGICRRLKWTKWASFLRCGYCQRSESSRHTPAVESSRGNEPRSAAAEEDVTVSGGNRGLVSRSPPKNAFLLTRCRSAPYRSSSLANRFWESATEKTEEVAAGRRRKLGIMEEGEGINGGINEELKGMPLILTRCKSEPAINGDKLFVSLTSS